MNVLVLAAHPDDEILGLGGTLLKHVSNGDKVFVHILTDGHSSRKESTRKLKNAVNKRKSCAEIVADKMGFSGLYTSDSFDQKLDTVPLIKIVHEIENYSSNVNPDYVYTHHYGDVNFDHKIVFEASINAFRPAGNQFPKRIFSFETFSSNEWGLPVDKNVFKPNYFVDISKFLSKKLEIISYYKQELKEYPHPRSLKGIKVSACKWGTYIHTEAAEAFELLRGVEN